MFIFIIWLSRHSHFQNAQKNSASLRSSIHNLRLRMTSYPCNKYEQIMPFYLSSVKYTLYFVFILVIKLQLKYNKVFKHCQHLSNM